MWSGWREGVNLGAWMEMECKYWDLGVRWDFDWVETHILKLGYVEVELGWSWEANLLTWMDVRHEMDGCEMPTSCPVWRWDATWILGWDNNHGNVRQGMTCMDVRRTFSDVDGLEIWDLDGAVMHFPGPTLRLDVTWTEMRQKCGILDWVAARPGWRWHVNLGAWVGMGREVGGGENHTVPCIELRWDLNGRETRYGWRWKKNFWTWMEVRQHMNGGETRFLGHGCRWGRSESK